MRHFKTISTTAVLALLMSPALAVSQEAADATDDPAITDGTGGTSANVTDDGSSAGGGDNGTGGSDPSGPTGTAANDGAFDALSPGGQKIARALADQQPETSEPSDVTGDSTGGAGDGSAGAATATAEPLSLDDLAAAKQDGKGWGEIFKEMQADGLTTEKNLGQVISKSNRRQFAATDPGTAETDVSGTTATEPTTAAFTSSTVNSQSRARRPVVISLGNGGTMTIGGGNGNAYGRSSASQGIKIKPGKAGGNAGVTAGGHGNGNASFVTGNGGGSRGQANGNAYGHGNAGTTAGATANAGIVSAAGGNAGLQATRSGISAAGGKSNGGGNGNGKAKGLNK